MGDEPPGHWRAMTTRRVYDTPAWKVTRLTALQRDGYQCQVKGPRCEGTATAVDHIVSLADGGKPYDLDNLRSACRPCNSWLSAKRTHRLRLGNDNRRAW